MKLWSTPWRLVASSLDFLDMALLFGLRMFCMSNIERSRCCGNPVEVDSKHSVPTMPRGGFSELESRTFEMLRFTQRVSHVLALQKCSPTFEVRMLKMLRFTPQDLCSLVLEEVF